MMQAFRLFEAFSWTWQYKCRFSFRITCFKETLEQLLENELYPFIKGIESVDSIMGHLAVPALNKGADTSATLSKSD
jgi:hypothetical protein